jgi:DNA-binding NarL/FixJ family response regulator
MMTFYIVLVLALTSAVLAVIYFDRNDVSQRDKKIIQLRLEGLSIRQIAEQVDIQKSQVHNICKKYGL